MTDRLLLWLVASFPILVMTGMILLPRWKKVRGPRRNKEIVAVLLAAAGIGAFATWRLLRVETASSHVFIQQPLILLLAVPAVSVIAWLQSDSLSGISRGRMWLAYLLRSAMVVLLALALAGLQMIVERDALTVVFALDISKSISETERTRALEFIRKTRAEMKANDEAGLLVFGARAALEIEPSALFEAPGPRAKINAVVDPNATNIAAALRNAAASLDQSSRRRIVLFTDGRQTTGDALEELKRLAAQGIDVWIVPLKNSDSAEMLVEKVVVPNELMWEQPFDANVFVWSNVKAQATLNLYPGDKAGTPKLVQKVDLLPGRNRIPFSGLRMHSGGAKEIRAVLEPGHPEDDTLVENNEGYAFTDVQTDSRVLVMTSDLNEIQSLLGALEGEKLDVDIRTPASLPSNPEDYRAFDCIVLANLARGFLSDDHMKVIESCVRDQGAGLIMIGGDQSFGAGGYLNTPIENALPVRMDLQNDRVMPSGALCIVLHTCEFADGNAWGKKISKAAINVLSPQDYAGLIYYSPFGAEQWCFKPTPVARKQLMFGLIDGTDPGDMPSLEKIVSMAVNELSKLQNVSLKHCIIITDGDPEAPQAGTIAAAKKGAITISAVSIFPHGGADINTLEDVCKQTGGRHYKANDPKKLPQIFVKEAAIVRKSLIHADDHGIPIALGTAGPMLKEFGNTFPSCKALVMTQGKPRAELQLFTTVNGEQVPILMSWRYGLGQAVAFTTDSTNRWAPDWVSWPGYKKFWTNIVRGTSRQRMPSNHTVTTRIEDGVAHVVVEGFDSKGEYLNFAKLVGNAVEPRGGSLDGEAPSHELNFTMTQPGRYEASFPVEKAGAYAITVIDQSDPKRPQSIVTGLANSYSAEFAHVEGDDALLQQMGDAATSAAGKNSGGRLKDLTLLLAQNPQNQPSGIFSHDQQPARQPTDLFLWLLIGALCLFPLDVAVRRLALDPEKFFSWIGLKLLPVAALLRSKKAQLNEALTRPARAPSAPPPDIVPTGTLSRDAQSRYEKQGGSAEAGNISLDPQADAAKKPVVGGTKVSPADPAASDYTSALLKAKKRAGKK